MDKALRPERFDVDPSSPTAGKQWNHWFFTFQNYLMSLNAPEEEKFQLLANHVSFDVFELIAECGIYEKAVDLLESVYNKPKNVVYARHLLCTCRQEVGQTLDQYLQRLKQLSKDCGFKSVTAEEYRSEIIRDSFIRGLLSNTMRQRLLEQDSLDLDRVFIQARTLEAAESQSISYSYSPTHVNESCAIQSTSKTIVPDIDTNLSAIATKCFFCGHNKHPRSKCPAKEAICKACNKVGHFQRVCKSSNKRITSCLDSSISALFSAAVPASLSQAIVTISVNGVTLNALVDTGSSDSYISSDVVYANRWTVFPSNTHITLASTNFSSVTRGHCFVKLDYLNTHYPRVKLSLLQNLCSDVLLGHDFLKQHKHLQIAFGGPKPPFSLCGLTAARVPLPTLFGTLSPDCKPVATRSRRLNPNDQKFVEVEIKRLLDEQIIEPSNSPWRAQVLVTTNANHKRRMVVDYSQTINRFTFLDAYPLPRIDNLIEKISQYEVYSTLDLKSAYHQIPIRENEKQYTAFEACGNLYHFRRIPFGVTNGVACIQRIVDDLIKQAELNDTFAYLDNVTICGRNRMEHDKNYENFMKAITEYGLTLNETKTIHATHSVTLLGYEVSKGVIKPDPERFRSLR